MDMDRQARAFREFLARSVGQLGRHAKATLARDVVRHQTQMEVGMFRSVDEALSWAYRTAARDIVKVSSLGTWRGSDGGRKTGESLSPQELHGGAAQVLGHVQRLPDLEQAIVHARYWPAKTEGGGQDPSYRQAVEMLAKSIMATQGTGMHSWRGACIVVRQYFEGEKSGINAVRKEEACAKAKALENRRGAWERLSWIDRRAEDSLAASLQAAGWVRYASDYEEIYVGA